MQINDRDFKLFADLVYAKSGIRLHDRKKELIRSRLAKRLRATGSQDLSEYYRYLTLKDTGEELVRMLDAVTTNETRFFREKNHFEFLENTVYPKAIDQERSQVVLRMWSAGCSSGEEPYSMAMSALEYFRGVRFQDVKILASDLSTHILRKAREGVYPEERLAMLPVTWRRRYFQKGYGKQNGFYRVKDKLKELILFRHQKLMHPFSFEKPLHIIFCRNTMIYFDKLSQSTLINRFYDNLVPGGYLFIGHSESLTGKNHRFDYIMPSIYRK